MQALAGARVRLRKSEGTNKPDASANRNHPKGFFQMNKFKPYLVTAAVVLVVLALVFRVAPANLRQAVIGA